ncbi:MAG TPA: AraC family transcriptional regulator, partial [Burkholderiaceae bacterium]|nr:AraC family transcriptional regulator [Burkholderiaceae bacterium]
MIPRLTKAGGEMVDDDGGALVRARMRDLVAELAPVEGMTPSALDGVSFGRSHRSHPRAPVLYEPGIFILCQGRKRGFLGDQSFTYDANHFLMLAVPMPFEAETVASEDEPLLGIKIRIDLGVAAELALAIAPETEATSAAEGIVSAPLDVALAETVERLLRALRSPLETRLFGASLLREVTYRVLIGPKGGALRAALAQRSHFGQIAKALRRIHLDYHERLDVDMLARESNLSAAAFHAHFKTVTATSPIQYLKAMRLHKARLMMIEDGVSASRASSRVGY